MKTDYEILIIGGGPGGITAGVYCARAGLKTAIVEREVPGGKVNKTAEIENYPGFTSILGPDLAVNLFSQAQAVGANFIFDEVIKINQREDKLFDVHLKSKILIVKAVIIATGTKERKLGVPGEDKLYGRGVSYCAVCDGAFFKEKPLIVVGGGLAAIEESLYLTKFASKVTLIHRREEFRAAEPVVNKTRSHPKVEFMLNYVVEEIIGETTVQAVVVKNLKTNVTEKIEVAGIFPLIGSDPITDFVKELPILNETNNIITDVEMKTSISGLFAVGDVRNTPLKQIATAVGDGAIAAQKAIDYCDNF
ncbi:thioredoxin reductase [Spiroplasma sabaudiense Ar-1343]|uniref:Thioredoxin reductase n=1 Tax=Spiroplasma sabaudiense Ar-1343 TaxID=1276257 RepID=W6A9I0_9MOLU|nr:thioredoxin-disulfide reductase [Spiroplasma sabaudiense]AHI53540.1 thioredoxin reductase [Spiroplasma sabaudiense Ar-1343]